MYEVGEYILTEFSLATRPKCKVDSQSPKKGGRPHIYRAVLTILISALLCGQVDTSLSKET